MNVPERKFGTNNPNNAEPLVRTDKHGTATIRRSSFWGIPLANHLSEITREWPVAKIVDKLQCAYVLADSPLHDFGLERALLPFFLAKAYKSGQPLEKVCVVIGNTMPASDIPLNLEKPDGTPSIFPSALPPIKPSAIIGYENFMPVIEGQFQDTIRDFGQPQSDTRIYAVHGNSEQIENTIALFRTVAHMQSNGGRLIVEYADAGCVIHIDDLRGVAVGLSGGFGEDAKRLVELNVQLAMAREDEKLPSGKSHGEAGSPSDDGRASRYKPFVTIHYINQILNADTQAYCLLMTYGNLFGRPEVANSFNYDTTYPHRIYLGSELLAFVRGRAQMYGLQVQ
jgi:hypothetical protein